ncbi:V/A-type H+-transporting ATPase subunit I [Streptomyces sp. SceaMP-e96]|uniref:V-type ATPase 116kDa subunit family protein n=1 Tax=Streptomyces TaxID=1883 RepID=UPI000823E2A8|nr:MULTISPECIES: V-type ATPase 116kDa subunit family protein [unclassified Streptomyces]SCK34874.1 V/A-type H+-transporting ATPase subunit I [Streptomyces sp. SceaMP-e96]
MPWSEELSTVPMQRVALVAPHAAVRESLVRIAGLGCIDLDSAGGPGQAEASATVGRIRALRESPAQPELATARPDPQALEGVGAAALLAGEAQLAERLNAAVHRGTVAALAGWCPAAEVPEVNARLGDLGSVLVPLRAPPGVDPPTALRTTGPVRRSFTSLVTTYGPPRYADLDPTWAAATLYAVMFGMMFGDVGHGALLLLGALGLYVRRPRRIARWHDAWPFVAAAAALSMVAGLAYGEFFGPTGVLPVLWLEPLRQPERLLLTAVAVGALLLLLAYVAGAVNRWREGGLPGALYSLSGIAGGTAFLGLAGVATGTVLHLVWLSVAGAVLTMAGVVLAAVGSYAGTARGLAGLVQTGVQLFDGIIRIASNAVSFARLAAFGLTHAALSQVIWSGTVGLSHHGPAGVLGAVALFLVGNALVFLLEALVAGVQALRLEYFELFSRVYDGQGRPFRPWHVPVRRSEVAL